MLSFFLGVLTLVLIARLFPRVALCIVVAMLLSTSAYAQSPSDIVGAVCSPDGQQILLYVVATIIASGLFTLVQTLVSKLPPPVQHALNFAFGNWRQILVALGKLK